MNAEEIIRRLQLEPLPVEGGYFRRTYQSERQLPAGLFAEHSGPRWVATAIFFLVTPEDFSALHVLPQDELFHFYLGDPVEMIQIHPDGRLETFVLGNDLTQEQRLQVLVPGGVWQGTRLKAGGAWALMGTTVHPGFEYEDYRHGKRAELVEHFPQHQKLIERFTRD